MSDALGFRTGGYGAGRAFPSFARAVLLPTLRPVASCSLPLDDHPEDPSGPPWRVDDGSESPVDLLCRRSAWDCMPRACGLGLHAKGLPLRTACQRRATRPACDDDTRELWQTPAHARPHDRQV